ncbi:hypothetical protein QUC31_006363 [Theobroma cacao]
MYYQSLKKVQYLRNMMKAGYRHQLHENFEWSTTGYSWRLNVFAASSGCFISNLGFVKAI